MKKCITIVLLLLCCSSYAQDNSKPDSRHELRFGIGDMMFETVRWHNEVHKDYSAISSGTSKPEDRFYGRKLLQHLFAGTRLIYVR